MANNAGGMHSFTGGASGTLYTDRRDFYITPNQVRELYPSVTPFYTFTAKVKTRGAGKDPQFKMFENRAAWVDMNFFMGAAIDWNTGSYEGTQTDIAVEATAGGSDNVGFLQKGDIIEIRAGSAGDRAKGSGATATYPVAKDQIVARCLVTLVDSQKQIHLENLSYAGGDTYNVVDQDPVRVVGHADPEGSDSQDGWSSELTTVTGSTQIIKTPLKLTGTLANMNLRGYDNERARLRDEKSKEHKVKLNGMYLKGYLAKASTSDRSAFPTNLTDDQDSSAESYNNQWRTSWGIIPLLQTYGTDNAQLFNRTWASYDMNAFIDDMEARSQYFNSDMTEYAFAGSKVLAELSKSGTSSFFERSGGSISLSDWRMTKLGFSVRTLVHPFGQLNIAWDPSLKGAPYNNMMVIVDPDNIERVIYRESKYQTAIQANDVDGIKDQYFSDEGFGCTLIEKHALFSFA